MEGKDVKVSDGLVVCFYNEEELGQIRWRPYATEIYSKSILKVEFNSAFRTLPLSALPCMCVHKAATSVSTP